MSSASPLGSCIHTASREGSQPITRLKWPPRGLHLGMGFSGVAELAHQPQALAAGSVALAEVGHRRHKRAGGRRGLVVVRRSSHGAPRFGPQRVPALSTLQWLQHVLRPRNPLGSPAAPPMKSRRIVLWISAGILGFQGATQRF